jgi:hypothetical protein
MLKEFEEMVAKQNFLRRRYDRNLRLGNASWSKGWGKWQEYNDGPVCQLDAFMKELGQESAICSGLSQAIRETASADVWVFPGCALAIFPPTCGRW